MQRRTYRMTKRAASVEANRRAILDAAEKLLAGPEFRGASLEAIAGRAGLSRGSVYQQFGSRAGLIEQLTASVEDRAMFDRVLAAASVDDPAAALMETMAEIVRFVHETGPLFDNLRLLAFADEDLESMVSRKDEAQARLVTRLVERTADADRLALPADAAVAVLVALARYEAVRRLLEASESAEAARSHVRHLIARMLTEP